MLKKRKTKEIKRLGSLIWILSLRFGIHVLHYRCSLSFLKLNSRLIFLILKTKAFLNEFSRTITWFWMLTNWIQLQILIEIKYKVLRIWMQACSYDANVFQIRTRLSLNTELKESITYFSIFTESPD